MELEKMIIEGIMAILPVYIPMKGNCSHILTFQGGTYEMNKTAKTMVMRLSKLYFIDLKSIRIYYGSLLNIKNLIPIPLDKENIFIPLKVRKPICKNDGSIGYINIKYINGITEKDENTIIRLNNDFTVECLNTIETVNKHIKNGNIIKRLFRDKANSITKDYSYIKGEYDRPATKGDIALIINEILRIKESIK